MIGVRVIRVEPGATLNLLRAGAVAVVHWRLKLQLFLPAYQARFWISIFHAGDGKDNTKKHSQVQENQHARNLKKKY